MAVMAITEGLDCRNCNEFQKQDRGCIEDSPIPQRWRIGDQESRRCPMKMAKGEYAEYLKAYSLFTKQLLPNGNSWLNESNKFIEAMFIIMNTSREKADDNG